MDKFIVDTSVAVKLFLLEEGRNMALELFRLAKENKVQLLAPSLILYELNNTLICQDFSSEEIAEFLSVFDLQIKSDVIKLISPNLDFLNKVAEIALIDTYGQGYISSYDATFHALALLENAILLTADKAHYRKTTERIGSIMLIENWTAE